MENLKDYSTEDLIIELEKRQEVNIYNCGRYAPYEAQITRKYSSDRGSVKLPGNYKLLVIN